MRWAVVGLQLVVSLLLLLLLLVIPAAGAPAVPAHESVVIDHAAGLGFAAAALRAVVLTPRLRDASAFSPAFRLGAAQEAAAVLLAEGALERLLDDVNVAGTLRRLLGPGGSRATKAHTVAAGPRGGGAEVVDGSNKFEDDLALQRRLQDLDDNNVCNGPVDSITLRANADHQQLNFFGGYENVPERCAWSIRCEGAHSGNAVVLRFSDVDVAQASIVLGGGDETEGFVSLYDGGNETALRVAHLTGNDLPENSFGARGGNMLVTFAVAEQYWQYTGGSGFSADYWCAPRQTIQLGCVDAAAVNYSPVATVNDGTCEFVVSSASLLAAIQQDPMGRAVWNRMGGWNATAPVCEWDGVRCGDDGHVSSIAPIVVWPNSGDLRCTIGDALGDFAKLQTLWIDGRGLSGTLPDSLQHLTMLTSFVVENSRLSGTLPNLGRLKSLQSFYVDRTSLSGSFPDFLVDLPWLQWLGFHHTALSGTLPPDLCDRSALWVRQLSRRAPPDAFGRSTSFMGFESMRLSGTIPDLSKCIACEGVTFANSAFTGLPSALPHSVTHIRLNANPFNATVTELSNLIASLPNVHSLSLALVNVDVILSGEEDFPDDRCNVAICWGTRVKPPNGCTVGAECSWQLQLVDADEFFVTAGSLVKDLAIGMNCSCDRTDCPVVGHIQSRWNSRVNRTIYLKDNVGSCEYTAAMVDNLDGTFTASIPGDWVRTSGEHSFRFFHGETEFKPFKDLIRGGGYGYDKLRTTNFAPRECPIGSNTQPDLSTGSKCVCDQGFEASTNSDGVASCHRSCNNGTVVTPQGDGCECPKGSYDTEAFGALLCLTGDWSDTAGSATLAAVSADRAQGLRCSDCPDDCAVCNNGVPTLRSGWRLNASTAVDFVALIAGGISGRPQFAFRCPSAEFETGGCPALGLQPVEQEDRELQSYVALAEQAMRAGELDAATVDIEAADRLETVVVDGFACLGNHTGRLCAPCSAGFFLKVSDDSCVSCAVPDASASTVLSAVLSVTLVTVGGAVLWRNRKRIRRVKAEFSTNLKIVLGLLQVLTLLKDTLNLVFPPQPQEMLSVAAVFTADFQGLMKLECSGWSWEGQWAISVFGLPLMGAVTVLAWYLWRRRRHDDIAAAKQGAVDSGFLCVMVLYPRVSTVVLSALRCRELGPGMSVLEADYSVECSHRMEDLAWLMVFLWPVGIPVGLLCLLWRQWRLSREQWVDSELQLTTATAAEDDYEGDSAASDESAQPLGKPPSLAEFNAERIRATFGFCTKDFRPTMFFWEPLDMLRKLALSGLLQFVDRGTAFQVFCGCVLAFGSCAAQIKVAPYAEPAANMLKTLVEAQIFITFLISFILRVMPTIRAAEPWDELTYGWVLVVTLSALLATAVGLTARQIWRRYGQKSASEGSGGEVVLELSAGLVLEQPLASGGAK